MSLTIFTDGACWFQRRLGFGWVALEGNKVCHESSGPVRNDGSHNFAAEVWAVLTALQWAYEHGHRDVMICTDFESMPKHVARRFHNERSYAVRLFDWVAQHPDLKITIRKVSGKLPMHERAHRLSQKGAAEEVGVVYETAAA